LKEDKLIKIGANVVNNGHYIAFQMADVAAATFNVLVLCILLPPRLSLLIF
jgi:hypothetical protein